MSAVDNVLAGLPGTSGFSARSFFWGFALCLLTAVTLQLTHQRPGAYVMDGSGASDPRFLLPPDISEAATDTSAVDAKAAVQVAAVRVAGTEADAGLVAPASCTSWLPAQQQGDDPWRSMKMIGRPSACLVNGRAIEELDPENNFRRSYTLGFTDFVEDKTYLLPWVLAAKDVSLSEAKRRVYLDLGANYFDTSVTWFLRAYPLDFTEVHAFERVKGRFVIPAPSNDDLAPIDTASRKRKYKSGPAPIPPWQLSRIKAYEKYVDTADNPAKATINVTRFIKDELKLTAEDVLIVKMDIEGYEWGVLDAWLKDPDMPKIIDELFVEVHYKHPSMKDFGWMAHHQTREVAAQLLNSLRAAGFYAHAWP